MKWPFWNIIPGAASIPKDLPTCGVDIPALTEIPVKTCCGCKALVVVPTLNLYLLITKGSPAWNWDADAPVFV